MTILTRTVAGEGATAALAAALAPLCRTGDCLLLQGDLGAGKTAFARGFIRALVGDEVEVVSPTFTLVQTYALPCGAQVWHGDLYRLEDPSDLDEIGLEEALQTSITLIEWPELARRLLPLDALAITLRAGVHHDERIIEFSSGSALWQERLKDMV